MKRVLVLVLLLGFAGCSPLACVDRDKDGGIGGTGDCAPASSETKQTV